MSTTRLEHCRCFTGPLHTNWGTDNIVGNELLLPSGEKVYSKSVAGWYPGCSNIRTTGRIARSFCLLHHLSFITSNSTVVMHDENWAPINFMLWSQVLSDKHCVLHLWRNLCCGVPPMVCILWVMQHYHGHLGYMQNQKNVTVVRTWAISTIQLWIGPSKREKGALAICMTLETGATLVQIANHEFFKICLQICNYYNRNQVLLAPDKLDRCRLSEFCAYI